MELERAIAFAAAQRRGILVTMRRDGRAQSSNILFVVVNDECWISLTETRAKTRNLRRDPRALLHVPGEDWWQFVVLDGTVTLTPPAASPTDEVVEQLVEYYRMAAGEHADWDEYRRVMVEEQRLIATLRATSAYGLLRD